MPTLVGNLVNWHALNVLIADAPNHYKPMTLVLSTRTRHILKCNFNTTHYATKEDRFLVAEGTKDLILIVRHSSQNENVIVF